MPVVLLGLILAALLGGFVIFMRGVLTGRGAFWGTQPVAADSPTADGAGRTVFPGVVVGSRAAGVGSPFTGRVSEVRVERGQMVKQGDVLFVMETHEFDKRLTEAAAAAELHQEEMLEAGRARDAEVRLHNRELAAAEAREKREREALYAAWGRIRELRGGRRPFRRRRRAAMADAENAKRGLERAKRSTAEARRAVNEVESRWEPGLRDGAIAFAQARAQVRKLKATLAAAVRTSPISGVVSRVDVDSQAQAAAGKPVVRVDAVSGIEAVALIPAEAASDLRAGATAIILHAEGSTPAVLTRTRDGEDRNLFNKLTFFEPEKPEGLLPDDRVQVVLTR